jgi:hypothetical protein
MCWICGCADHLGPGNEEKDEGDPDSNQLNDIIDE